MAEELRNPFFGKARNKASGLNKDPIDAPFKVKESFSVNGNAKGAPLGGFTEVPPSKGAYPFDDKKTGDIPGVRDAGPSLSEQLEETKTRKELEFEKKKLRDAQKLNKKPGFFTKQYKTVEGARRLYHQKRQLSLERRQNVATLKANIATQKQNVLQSKTVKAEAKLKLLEIKKARRDFLKSQQLERQQKRSRPLSDQDVRGKSLLGKVKQPISGSNPISGPQGFFAGTRKAPARAGGNIVRKNAVSPGGFFAGVGKKGRKKGGFFS